MKNLFLLLLAAIPVAVEAQDKSYDSILDEEKTWTIKTVGSNLERTVSYAEYKLKDNTTIDGIPYKQLLSRDRWEWEDDWGEWKCSKAFIGEDSQGKVYYYLDYGFAIENVVTMDYSMQVGDIIRIDNGSFPYIVTTVSDTVLENSVDRKPRKCIYISHIYNGEILNEDFNRDVWIEGIGSLREGLMGTRDLVGGSCQLVKCTQQGKVIYQNNDATSVQGIKRQPVEDDKCYDLQGRRLTDKPARGVYIEDGRKRVVK